MRPYGYHRSGTRNDYVHACENGSLDGADAGTSDRSLNLNIGAASE